MGLRPIAENPVRIALFQLASSQRAESMMRFFKTSPGEYGEGDQFWGISVSDQRAVLKSHRELPLEQIDQLIQDPIHECRLSGLLILVARFMRCRG